jgi:hypothetical protein
MTTRYFVIARTDCAACGGKVSTVLHTPAVVGQKCCEVCGCKGYTEELVELEDVLMGTDITDQGSAGSLFAEGASFVATTTRGDPPGILDKSDG